MYESICVYIYMYIYIYIYIYICMYVCMYVWQGQEEAHVITVEQPGLYVVSEGMYVCMFVFMCMIQTHIDIPSQTRVCAQTAHTIF